MITEERLRELIEQKATIYVASRKFIEEVKEVSLIPQNEEFYLKIVNDYLMSITDNEYIYDDVDFIYALKDLFETREEAEWQLEFENITRTETLKLPTWEEFCKAPDLDFYGAEHNLYNLFSDLEWLRLREDVGDYYDNLFYKRATKENYIEACRLAKKLFLGESDG